MAGKSLTFINGCMPADIAQMLLDRGYTITCKPDVEQRQVFYTVHGTTIANLPSVESCMQHVQSVWKDEYMTTEALCAIEEVHDFIERKIREDAT